MEVDMRWPRLRAVSLLAFSTFRNAGRIAASQLARDPIIPPGLSRVFMSRRPGANIRTPIHGSGLAMFQENESIE
jgi:hypothetical protein